MNSEPEKVTLSTFVCKHLECNHWAVGFYDPSGRWITVADVAGKERAFYRVHLLHGGSLAYLDFLRWWGAGE